MIAGLLIGIVIIGLAFFGYQKFWTSSVFEPGNFQSKTNTLDSSRRVDIDQIVTALQSFAASSAGEYPASLNTLVGNGLKQLPSDPGGGASYVYEVLQNRRAASLYAVLETGRLYCWRSATGKISDVDRGKCLP